MADEIRGRESGRSYARHLRAQMEGVCQVFGDEDLLQRSVVALQLAWAHLFFRLAGVLERVLVLVEGLVRVNVALRQLLDHQDDPAVFAVDVFALLFEALFELASLCIVPSARLRVRLLRRAQARAALVGASRIRETAVALCNHLDFVHLVFSA